MSKNKNDYEHMLFYFAYKTFITTADEIIEQYGMSRQHHRFLFFINKLRLKYLNKDRMQRYVN